MTAEAERNPREIIDAAPMAWRQWLAIAITVGLNALDGIDVLSVSYAAPGIAREWNLAPSTLGWVLSMELLGMAIGSVALGGLADRAGRRTTILIALVVMAVGMFGASSSSSVLQLLGWRLLTGLGIGGMLPAINTAAAELSNRRWRSLAMALMVIGYPLGGALGGVAVQALYGAGGTWHDVFRAGGFLTLAFIPAVLFLLPETPAFFDRSGALAKANAVLARLGHAPAAVTSPRTAEPKIPLAEILQPGLRATTVFTTLVYFLHMTSFYFMAKWTPKIVAGLGHSPSVAAGTLAYANVGGALGGALLGFLAVRFTVRRVTGWALVGTFVATAALGLGAADLDLFRWLVFAAGFFGNAGIAGLYLLLALVFPTRVRGTGSGFAIGIGRGGAVFAPVVAGYLFAANLSLALVAFLLGCCSLVAALMLRGIKVPPAE